MLKRIIVSVFVAAVFLPSPGARAFGAAKLALVTDVELQPLAAQVQRLIEARDYLGEPFPETEKRALESAMLSLFDPIWLA